MRKRAIRWGAAALVLLALLAGACPPGQAAEPLQGNEAVQPALTQEEKAALLAALWEADISSTREAIRRGFLSCEELTAYYLERIETYNDTYNCFITLCDDALEVARQRDAQLAAGEGEGLLFGIPVVVKDNIHYAGYPTTNGRKSRLGQISTENEAVVDYLLEQGAVILGKTNMSTDAQVARTSISGAVGETKNAYDPTLASGGSSGGSAVAVALNFAMAGLGTDTNSSLRYPAALNGCVTLRATGGLLSKEGIIILNRTRDTPGAITRTVYDQAVMMDVLSGGAYSYTENLNGGALEGLRIGVLKELARPGYGARSAKALDDEVEAAFDAAVEELRQCGAEVVEVSLSGLLSLSRATFSDSSGAARERYYAAFQKLLADNGLSAVIFPTYYSTPHRSGRDGEGVYHNANDQPFINNCSELSSCINVPEMTVPIGFHSMGAGIGLEIAADRNCEQLLLDIAYSYTLRYDHRSAPTGAPDLYGESYAGTLTERMAAYDQRVWEEAEAARLEAERIEAERLEAQRQEELRRQAEQRERERLEAERLERERAEAERIAAEERAVVRRWGIAAVVLLAGAIVGYDVAYWRRHGVESAMPEEEPMAAPPEERETASAGARET